VEKSKEGIGGRRGKMLCWVLGFDSNCTCFFAMLVMYQRREKERKRGVFIYSLDSCRGIAIWGLKRGRD
jgi:hypothetical protein